MDESKQWYAVYTRPRWEKKVHALLERGGLQSYCPLNKVHRQWSDRIKTVETPLFSSYVFVRISESEKPRIRETEGIVNFVYWQGKPAIIKDYEIQRIRRFLDEYDDVLLEDSSSPLIPGDLVTIRSGALMDQEAEVLKSGKKKVFIAIHTLGVRLVASIDRNKIKKA